MDLRAVQRAPFVEHYQGTPNVHFHPGLEGREIWGNLVDLDYLSVFTDC